MLPNVLSPCFAVVWRSRSRIGVLARTSWPETPSQKFQSLDRNFSTSAPSYNTNGTGTSLIRWHVFQYYHEHIFSILVLAITVVGCPHPKPPRHSWVRRSGDRAVIKCNHTTEVFYLTCKGMSWVGAMSNCTKGMCYTVYIYSINYMACRPVIGVLPDYHNSIFQCLHSQ